MKSYFGDISGFINDVGAEDDSYYTNFTEVNIINSFAIIMDAWLYNWDDNDPFVAGFIADIDAYANEYGVRINIINSFVGLNYVFIGDSDSTVVGVTEDRDATMTIRNVFFSQLPDWYSDIFNPLSTSIKGTDEDFNRDMIGLKASRFVDMFLSDSFYFNTFWDNSVWNVGEDGLDLHDNPLFELYETFFIGIEQDELDLGQRLIPQLVTNPIGLNALLNWNYSVHERLSVNADMLEYLFMPKTTLFLEQLPSGLAFVN
jgi:hypothetical protein